MRRVGYILAPGALTTCRLLAGPAYLLWGPLPAGAVVLALMTGAATTDLLDGRVARVLGVTSTPGAVFDTLADKIFVLCLALKLAFDGVISGWIFGALLAQYVTLAVAGAMYSARYRQVPVPGSSARIAALAAVLAVLVGVATGSHSWTTLLALLLVLANFSHLFIAWLRVVGPR